MSKAHGIRFYDMFGSGAFLSSRTILSTDPVGGRDVAEAKPRYDCFLPPKPPPAFSEVFLLQDVLSLTAFQVFYIDPAPYRPTRKEIAFW